MPQQNLVTLTDNTEACAVVAPELGGWLLRYLRPLPGHGPVDALHFSQAVVDRYPRQIYAGNPILFPLVSFNHLPELDHHYEWEGCRYEMPQHGFARRLKWSVVARSASEVTLELSDSDITRANYPFRFRQRLTYRLADGRLAWEQEIVNLSTAAMPFSTGFHPYFAVPFTARSNRAACFVELPVARRLTMHGRGDHFSGRGFPAQNWSVQEDVSTPMLLADLKRRVMILVDPVSELEVEFNFEQAPQHRFVALWAKSPNEPYYCLEPWTALSNSFTRVKDHELILLEPEKSFRAAFWMELRPMA
jgi:galactose mutarotase-like enzyme